MRDGHVGDLIMSPVRIRQVRGAARADGFVPPWHFGAEEAKSRLTLPICTKANASEPVEAAASDASDAAARRMRRLLHQDDAVPPPSVAEEEEAAEAEDAADLFGGDRGFCEHKNLKYSTDPVQAFSTSYHGLWYDYFSDAGYSIILHPRASTEEVVAQLEALEAEGWLV